MSWLSRLANIFRSDRLDRDLDAELRFHIEAGTEELIARGLTPADAARGGCRGEAAAGRRRPSTNAAIRPPIAPDR